MTYIDTETGVFGLTEADIKAANPNTSFPEPFVPLERYARVLPTDAISYDNTLQGAVEAAPLLLGGVYIQQWEIVDLGPDADVVPVIRPDAVDAERDRRIDAGVEFNGVLYQSKPGDRENIAGSSQFALRAKLGGAEPGYLRWADESADFVWIANDNSRVPMDVDTMLNFAKAALLRKQSLIFAGSDLKSMDPIPLDYRDDKWWP